MFSKVFRSKLFPLADEILEDSRKFPFQIISLVSSMHQCGPWIELLPRVQSNSVLSDSRLNLLPLSGWLFVGELRTKREKTTHNSKLDMPFNPAAFYIESKAIQ